MTLRVTFYASVCFYLLWPVISIAQTTLPISPSSQPTTALQQEVVAWADFTAGILEPGIVAVFPDPSISNRIFAAAKGTLYLSLDNGNTWRVVGTFRAKISAKDDQGVLQDTQVLSESELQQIRDDAVRELADELGIDDLDLLNDPNNLDLDERIEDRIAEASFAKKNSLATLSSAGQARQENFARQIAVAKNQPNFLLLATSSGLFRSTENGALLTRLPLPKNPDVLSILVDKDAQIVLAGTSRGLLLSQDAGNTWVSTTSPGLNKNTILALDANFQNTDLVAALTTRGVFLSEDSGQTFTQSLSTPPGFLRDLAWMPGNENTLYAATSQGLFQTKDKGASWASVIQTPQSISNAPIARVTLHPAGQVFIAMVNGEVFVSKDGGQRFENTGDGLPVVGLSSLEADPKTPEVVWATTGEGLYRYGPIQIGLVSEQEKKRMVEAFRAEPSVGDVIGAAIALAKLEVTESRQERAELAAYFPRLRLQATARLELSQSLDVEAGVPTNVTLVDNADLNVSFLAIWDIATLMRLRDDVRIFEKRRARRRSRLEARIAKLYEERRAVQLGLLRTPPSDLIAYLKAELRLQELTALLNAASGGYFSAAYQPEKASATE